MISFRVLGPVEAIAGNRRLELGSPKQRALLAVLLVHRGEPVSLDRLIDELWGELPPASANKIVQGYVSNLRKVLGDGLLLTQGRGYMLQTEPGQIDVDQFESLVAAGRRALEKRDARTAAGQLREALGLWRGPPLADFAYESFAQPEIARLQESRLAALEERIDAELALGEHAQLVSELEGLVREHPLRERLVGQLMLALYRSGRQADALEAYREARHRLVEELGLEPSRDLQQLERAILAQDPALEGPPRDTTRDWPATARRSRRGGLLLVAGGAGLLAVLVVFAVRLAGPGATTVQVAPNSLAVIDTGSNRVVAAVPVGSRPGAVVSGSGSLWVANLDDQTVSRINPGTLEIVRTITVGDVPTGLAASARGIWVEESDLNPNASNVSVGLIDPEFNVIGPRLRIGNVVSIGHGAVAARGNSVWVAPSAGLLTRLEGTTGRVAQQLDPNATPAGIAVGAGAVWLTDTGAGNVIRVDPTGFLTPIAVGNGPGGIAVGAGGVWVADSFDNAVVRIDPSTRSVTNTIPVGRSPAGIAVGAGSVWVANGGDGTVSRINPRTDKVLTTIVVGGSPQGIAIAGGRAWVSVDPPPVAPIGPASGEGTLRIDSPNDVDSMDPALAYTYLSAQLLWATCAQLVSYPDKAGPVGSLPIPEVAQSLPARSPDGRTYTFTIRPGFRFSPPSNQPVDAQTFKYAIERTLNPKMNSLSAPFLADVVGARAYMAGNASHIAGVVAHGNTLAIRLVVPAPNFLFRIAFVGFCAVPSNTPVDPGGVRLVPSAGPYYVDSYAPGQGVVLVRNPNYHGNRPHHFARIQLAVGVSPQRAIADIEAGRADYLGLTGGAPLRAHGLATVAAQLAARYGPGTPAAASGRQQYYLNPLLETHFIVLNTHRPLFSDSRMRQAVNYAIDRRALAALGNVQGGPDRPTDHYLPPGIAGFRDLQIYPPTPDLAKARRLAHGNGRTAVLYSCNESPCLEQAQIVKTDLATIGLQIQIKSFPPESYFGRLSTPGEPFDLAFGGWRADYPDPQGMLNPILSDASYYPTLIDPIYVRRLAAAAQLSGPERYLTYGALDLDLARSAAPLVAYGNPTSSDFFAARIGCQTYSYYFGMDVGALCLRRASH